MPQPIRFFLITEEQRNIDVCNELVSNYPNEFKLVGIATTGQSGIEQAKELKPNVVLVDISILDIDCRDIIKVLSSELPDSEFIVMQVSGDAALFRLFMDMGVRFFLTKPLSMEHVREEVSQAFKWLSTRKERDGYLRNSPPSSPS